MLTETDERRHEPEIVVARLQVATALSDPGDCKRSSQQSNWTHSRMIVVVEAELYVLGSSEGGCLDEIRSGCDAILNSEGFETAVDLQLLERDTLRAGESGMTSLTLLEPESPRFDINVGEAFTLTVAGDKAAIGQILEYKSYEEPTEVVSGASGSIDDPPRLVVLVSILLGGLFVLLFARNVGALWQKLIGLVISVVAIVIWSVYSELKTNPDSRCRDEPADARESRS